MSDFSHSDTIDRSIDKHALNCTCQVCKDCSCPECVIAERRLFDEMLTGADGYADFLVDNLCDR